MQTSQLPIWKTLGSALTAPFSLSPASWKALSGPLLALAGTTLLAFATVYLGWSEMTGLPAALLVLAAGAWLTLEFQRHLLLGAVARGSGVRPWRRYGLYVLAVVMLALLLGVLSGLLLSFALPTMTFSLMALNSPVPWVAAGSVVLGVLAFAIAAYPSARLALMLPALAVDHAAGPGSSWRLSRGNGLRLLALLGLMPVLQQVLELAMPTDGSALPNVIAGALLASYLTLVDTAVLAFAYRTLTDRTLPVMTADPAGPGPALGTRIVAPLSLVVVMGLGGATLWHAVPRMESDGASLVTSLGQPQDIESKASVKPELPAVEETRPISDGATFSTVGDGRFLTISKKSLSLRYGIDWQVSDARRYAQAGAGNTERGKARIDRLARRLLRERVNGLSSEKVRHLADASSAAFNVDEAPPPDALFDDILKELNSRAMELGVEITAWRIEVVKRAS